MYASVQDWARFGQFLLQDGMWDGQRLLGSDYVAMMHSPAPASRGKYARGQLWLEGPEARDTPKDGNADQPFGLPADIYWMQGHDIQVIALIPSLQLAVVRMGLTPDDLYYQPQALVAEIIKALQ
jgi:CubicO group peptidase (beta-lactamase class C family)